MHRVGKMSGVESTEGSSTHELDTFIFQQVIREAIIASSYSIPGKQTEHGPDYAPIYFMAYEECSLRLDTTVYYEPSSSTEVVVSDINLRVNRALKENGIEIPYPYLNVVQKQRHE